MLVMTLETRSEMTQSVIFHLIDNIHTSIHSWIMTAALDFEPYHVKLYNVNEYAKSIELFNVTDASLLI